MKETTLIFFALCCLTVCQAAVCPFPGITARAAFADGPISWVRRRTFREGNRVKYTCKGDSYSGHSVWSSMYWGEDDVLTCLPDGTWDRPLPQCGIKLSKDAETLEVEYGHVTRGKWSDINSCSSNQTSDFYTVKLPVEMGKRFQVEITFCWGSHLKLFLNSSLDQIKSCSRDLISGPIRSYVRYFCEDFNPENIQHSISIHLREVVPLDNIYIITDPGNHCGWPPVPVHADVVTEFIPGTTEVTYKCNDKLVLDPNGPQGSTCDHLIGRWTELPRCICPDPSAHVPGGGRMIRREAFTARFQCGDGYQLIGEETITCDAKGLWKELPSCEPSPIVTVLAVCFTLILLLMIVFLVTWILIQRKRGFIFVSKRTPGSQIQLDHYEKCGPPATSNEPAYQELIPRNATQSSNIYENDKSIRKN